MARTTKTDSRWFLPKGVYKCDTNRQVTRISPCEKYTLKDYGDYEGERIICTVKTKKSLYRESEFEFKVGTVEMKVEGS